MQHPDTLMKTVSCLIKFCLLFSSDDCIQQCFLWRIIQLSKFHVRIYVSYSNWSLFCRCSCLNCDLNCEILQRSVTRKSSCTQHFSSVKHFADFYDLHITLALTESCIGLTSFYPCIFTYQLTTFIITLCVTEKLLAYTRNCSILQ